VVVCLSVCQRQIATHTCGHRMKIREKSTNSATFSTLHFWRLATLATLDDFSVYFVISKLLTLAYFWATNEE